MMIKNLTADQIRKMNYNELIGLTKETNRTPGGLNTILRVSQLLMLNERTKLLDIGTSTGHTALEFSRLLHCNITGIDINPMSLDTATARAKNLNLTNVSFLKDDATNLSFEDNTFDVVFCGNVTSLVDNRDKALKQYWRVLKDSGYLVAVPMYYVKKPSDKLLDDVRNAIQVNIEALYKNYWVDFFTAPSTELYFSEDYLFDSISDESVIKFCDMILSRDHLNDLSHDARAALKECYINYMRIFRENLSHMGFSILIYRKKEDDTQNDYELFTSRLK